MFDELAQVDRLATGWAFINRYRAYGMGDSPSFCRRTGNSVDTWRTLGKHAPALQRSSAAIDPAIPGHYWGRLPKSDARLRLIDPQYGFVTPPARFFTVSFDNERVSNIRMSPQIEPLLLDDTLKVVLDLQEQWRKGGWIPVDVNYWPPFADTPEWRAKLRNVNKGGKSYWQAGNKYKVMMVVGRFQDDRNPTEERYLITLQLTDAT